MVLTSVNGFSGSGIKVRIVHSGVTPSGVVPPFGLVVSTHYSLKVTKRSTLRMKNLENIKLLQYCLER